MDTFTFFEHLDELRGRLIKSLAAVALGACVVYHFSDAILTVLAKPVGKLVFIDPTEAFIAYLKLSVWGGLFLASPFVIYHLWKFVGGGLKKSESRYVYMYAPASFLLFLLGASFGFFVIISFGMKFLLSFGSNFMAPMITISRYISFLGAMIVAFGLVFQLPLVMHFLTKLGVVTPEFLSAKRKYAMVCIFIAAGVLTPGPDIFSQLSMAVPLLILYEVGVILSKSALIKPREGLLKQGVTLP
ncbi:MAG: twin-arginine translocase subunit TatC [Candidatus Omnitrophota bacterium]